MQRAKLLVFALLAVSMFSAVAAATASAELPVILNARGEVAGLTKFEGTSRLTTRLSTLGSSVEVTCPETETRGEFEARSPLGPFHLDFKGCTTTAGGKCTGLGEETGVILSLGTIHIVYDVLRPELGAAVLFLIQNTHFECEVLIVHKLILTLGQLLCLITPISRLSARSTITCETTRTLGDPKEVTYWNDAEREVNIAEGLLSSENDSTFTMSAESGSGEVRTTSGEEINIMA